MARSSSSMRLTKVRLPSVPAGVLSLGLPLTPPAPIPGRPRRSGSTRAARRWKPGSGGQGVLLTEMAPEQAGEPVPARPAGMGKPPAGTGPRRGGRGARRGTDGPACEAWSRPRGITANDLLAEMPYSLVMLDVRRLRVLREVAAQRLVLRRGRGARLHPARRLAPDRHARGRGGHAPGRALGARHPPDPRRRAARRARRRRSSTGSPPPSPSSRRSPTARAAGCGSRRSRRRTRRSSRSPSPPSMRRTTGSSCGSPSRSRHSRWRDWPRATSTSPSCRRPASWRSRTASRASR